MKLRFAVPSLLLIAGALATACDDSEPTPVVAVEEPGDGDTVVHDTIVFTAEDGTVQSREVPITLRERRAQEAARAAGTAPSEGELGTISQAAISSDAACGGASLWLYDGTTSTSKRLCLHNPTNGGVDVSLGAFCHTSTTLICPSGPCGAICTATWDGKVQRYWPGAKDGGLFQQGNNYAGSPSDVVRFYSYGPAANPPTGFTTHSVKLHCPGAPNGLAGAGNSSCPG